ncbi:DUF2252 family protein [Cohnella faecalis]|uniref:DUF2252 domain-containing protein n=1 Tax=Cohnella faecalis TaxID=2315694 RepID=A0A398CPD0_9BACL|nr:DUF2252 family protein [Cohnella faecalis]RIE04020.1 DUF2252 domain-containing protein [Cohnella faecalis]
MRFNTWKKTAVMALSAAIVSNAAYLPAWTPAAAAAEANHIVISEIFGGGSHNTDSPYRNDFIELYNPTGTVQSLQGWSVQFLKVTDSTSQADNMTVGDGTIGKVTLTGDIQPHGYYLIKLGAGTVATGFSSGSGKELTGENAADTSLNMNKDGGMVALLSSDSDFDFGASSGGAVVDFVGYGGSSGSSKPSRYGGSNPAPKGSAQKSLIRKAVNPSDGSSLSTLTGVGVFKGNGFETAGGDNALDFEVTADKSQVNPQNSSFFEPMAAGAASAADLTVSMDSTTTVDPSNASFVVNATHGTLSKSELAQGADFVLNGLPAGLTATAIAAGTAITITLSGQAAADVLADVPLALVLLPSAFSDIYGASEPISGPVLLKSSTKITGAAADSTVSMSDSAAVSSADNSFAITLVNGTVSNGPIAASHFSISGLPAGLTFAATGDGAKTITFTVGGAAASGVFNDASVSVVIKKEAIVSGATEDSDMIGGIVVKRPSAALLNDAARANAVTEILKSVNAFHSDAYDKSYKYSEMAAKTFKFFRGNAAIFYRDLGTTIPVPTAWKSWSNVDTWIEGDAHTRNIGFFDHNDGEAYFDLNDPDESFKAPFYFDLIRFITSLYITRDDVGAVKNTSTPAEVRQAAKDFLDQYRTTLTAVSGEGNDFENTVRIDESFLLNNGFNYSGYMLKTFYGDAAATPQGEGLLDNLSNRDLLDGNSAKGVKGFTRVVDGQRSFVKIANAADSTTADEKLLAVTASEESELRNGWSGYANLTRLDTASKADYFAIKDMARVIEKGLGSIGVRRYFVLIEGPTAGTDDDVVLDVKQQRTPASIANPFVSLDYSAYASKDAVRTKAAYDYMSAKEDPFVGSLDGSSKTYLVRKISAFDRDYDDKKFGSFTDFKEFLKASAMAYAFAHARADRDSGLGYSFEDSVLPLLNSDWTSIRDTLVNLGEDYAKQVEADYNLFKAVPRASLIDVADLASLAVDAGALSPTFDGGKNSYTLSVANTVSTLTVTPKPADSLATMTVNGDALANGAAKTIALNTGANTVTIVVKAQDQSTKTYILTATRAAASDNNNGNNGNSGNGNGNGGSAGNENGGSGPLVVKANSDGKGNSLAEISGKQIDELIHGLSGGQSAGKEPVIEIQANVDPGTKQAAVKISAEAVGNIAGSQAKRLKIGFGIGSISFDEKAINAISGAAVGEDAIFSVSIVGSANDRPVYELKIAVGGKSVSSFGGGTAAVSVPYTLGAGEDANAIVVYYVAESGEKTLVTNGEFDAATGQILFKVVHFSKYEVAYNKRSFGDIGGSFAKDSIAFLSARNIISGFGDGSFAPKSSVTRADFIVMLAKLAGAELGSYGAPSFQDVASDAYYAKSIAWANGLGIAGGTGGGKFAPKAAITREQMSAIIVRFVSATQQAALPQTAAPITFEDRSEIQTFASAAVTTVQRAGLISGKTIAGKKGVFFAPQKAATREETAVILAQLHRLIVR